MLENGGEIPFSSKNSTEKSNFLKWAPSEKLISIKASKRNFSVVIKTNYIDGISAFFVEFSGLSGRRKLCAHALQYNSMVSPFSWTHFSVMKRKLRQSTKGNSGNWNETGTGEC